MLKVHTKRRIKVKRTKRVCAADVFFCHIYFEQSYGAHFPNNSHSKQDPRPLSQQRS